MTAFVSFVIKYITKRETKDNQMFNLSEIMKRAWTRAKADDFYEMTYDWKLKTNRPTTSAEKREIFAEALKYVWASIKADLAYEARQAKIAASPEAQKIIRDIDALKDKSFLIQTTKTRRALEMKLSEILEVA